MMIYIIIIIIITHTAWSCKKHAHRLLRATAAGSGAFGKCMGVSVRGAVRPLLLFAPRPTKASHVPAQASVTKGTDGHTRDWGYNHRPDNSEVRGGYNIISKGGACTSLGQKIGQLKQLLDCGDDGRAIVLAGWCGAFCLPDDRPFLDPRGDQQHRQPGPQPIELELAVRVPTGPMSIRRGRGACARWRYVVEETSGIIPSHDERRLVPALCW
jgi:hypothetical protein